MTIIRKYNRTIAFALCVAVLFVILCLINRSNAFAFGTGGCDGECNKCHSSLRRSRRHHEKTEGARCQSA